MPPVRHFCLPSKVCLAVLWPDRTSLEATLKTYAMKEAEIAKDWLVIDASGIVLGRLATHVATFLRGKHKPTFQPNLDMGDNVIVINARHIKLTGQKLEKKVYLHHTGYMSGQRATTMKKLMQARPERVVTKAVWGMMPKTRLGRRQMTHLRVYAGGEHTHTAQQPRSIEIA